MLIHVLAFFDVQVLDKVNLLLVKHLQVGRRPSGIGTIFKFFLKSDLIIDIILSIRLYSKSVRIEWC